MLCIVEIFLSADNILAISLLLDRIEIGKRRIALLLGVWSCLLFRAIIIAFTSFLFLVDSLKALGGIYLLYLAISHLIRHKSKQAGRLQPISLLWGIISIELTDVLFALDSIFIALGLLSFFYSEELVAGKIWVAYVGGAFGVVTLRFFASSLLLFINKHPTIEKIAYYLIGWIGVKLILIGFNLTHFIPHFNTIFSIGVLFIVLYSFFSTKSAPKG